MAKDSTLGGRGNWPPADIINKGPHTNQIMMMMMMMMTISPICWPAWAAWARFMGARRIHINHVCFHNNQRMDGDHHLYPEAG
jgi:hypothetical protein